jgi:hypothetical protein
MSGKVKCTRCGRKAPAMEKATWNDGPDRRNQDSVWAARMKAFLNLS